MAIPPIWPPPGTAVPPQPVAPLPPPPPGVPEALYGALTPEIRRLVVDKTDYRKLIELLRVRKFAIIADPDNTVVIQVAGKQITTDNTTEFQDFAPSDSVLWEATRPNESLSMTIWARVASGSAVLYVWFWK